MLRDIELIEAEQRQRRADLSLSQRSRVVRPVRRFFTGLYVMDEANYREPRLRPRPGEQVGHDLAWQPPTGSDCAMVERDKNHRRSSVVARNEAGDGPNFSPPDTGGETARSRRARSTTQGSTRHGGSNSDINSFMYPRRPTWRGAPRNGRRCRSSSAEYSHAMATAAAA